MTYNVTTAASRPAGWARAASRSHRGEDRRGLRTATRATRRALRRRAPT